MVPEAISKKLEPMLLQLPTLHLYGKSYQGPRVFLWNNSISVLINAGVKSLQIFIFSSRASAVCVLATPLNCRRLSSWNGLCTTELEIYCFLPL